VVVDRFEVVVVAAMMCGREGVTVCVGVRGDWLGGVQTFCGRELFFRGWLGGGCFRGGYCG
jgi:hypothetical protein